MPGIFGRGSQETVCGGAEEVNPAGARLPGPILSAGTLGGELEGGMNRNALEVSVPEISANVS